MRASAGDETVAWFRQQDEGGNLNLSPQFQRRPVWQRPQKANLIDSILRGLPIPEVFVFTETTAEGDVTYTVVDGQQRITAILEFMGSDGRESFAVDELDKSSPWQDATFSDLPDEDRARFYSYRLAVRQLTDTTFEAVRDLFQRFNRYLTPLNDQELRNATFWGPFIKTAEELSETSYWSDVRLFTAQDIRRMRDVEFVSDLMIGIMHGPQSANRQTLDDYYQTYEAHPDSLRPVEVRYAFTTVLGFLQASLHNIRNLRWSNRGDFYSLFVVLAEILEKSEGLTANRRAFAKALEDFVADIDTWRNRREGEHPQVLKGIPAYVEGLSRGSTDQSRRSGRHDALLAHLQPLFTSG